MLAETQTKVSVETFITRFMESYRNRNLEQLLELVPPDDDIYMFGTGIDEKRRGRQEFEDQVKRDWAQTEELDFQLNLNHVSIAGPIAWIAAEGLGKGKAGGREIEFPLRMTAVLKSVDGEWRLVQGHISLPAPGEEEGSSVPV